jgi:response regulator of citrate/malate metabolism
MGFELGASHYLIKPVDRDRLAVLIEKHRAARSSAATDAEVLAPSIRRDPSSKKEKGRLKGTLPRTMN